MKSPLLTLGLLAYACSVMAEPNIVNTLVVKGYVTNSVGGLDWLAVTNVVEIPNGRAGRVSMILADDDFVTLSKDDVSWRAEVGHVVQGPARIAVGAYGNTSIVTVEQWTVKKEKK